MSLVITESLIHPPKPARDWVKYNEELVQRGRISLYLETLETWKEDLLKKNGHKKGRKYDYPDSIFFVAWVLRFLFSLTFRSLEGLLRDLGKEMGFHAPNYTTIQKRCQQIDLRQWFPQQEWPEELIVAIDASGIKVMNYGDWMRHKWHEKAKTRRGWIKMHVIVDTETHQALDVQITKEDVADEAMFTQLIENVQEQGIKIERALGDGAFDDKKIHNDLAKASIKPGIPPRKNASSKSRGSPARAAEVRFFQDYGEKLWKLTRQYNKRVAVERVFSVFKQLFGEGVMARKWENIQHELKAKFWLLNWLLSCSYQKR